MPTVWNSYHFNPILLIHQHHRKAATVNGYAVGHSAVRLRGRSLEIREHVENPPYYKITPDRRSQNRHLIKVMQWNLLILMPTPPSTGVCVRSYTPYVHPALKRYGNLVSSCSSLWMLLTSTALVLLATTERRIVVMPQSGAEDVS